MEKTTNNRRIANSIFDTVKTMYKLSQSIDKLAQNDMLSKSFDAELGAIRDNLICISRAIEPIMSSTMMCAIAEQAAEEIEEEETEEAA